jgi:hypothetical protein
LRHRGHSHDTAILVAGFDAFSLSHGLPFIWPCIDFHAGGIAHGTRRAHVEVVGFMGRAILWILLIVAPGGVFLLPLLVGDSVVRRRRKEAAAKKAAEASTAIPADAHVVSASMSGR